MATPKARYLGSNPIEGKAFNEAFKEKLRKFYPGIENTDIVSSSSPEDFVDEILIEAAWAADELASLKLEITNQEVGAERRDLLKTLQKSVQKLRNLSQDFDILLGSEADPLGCADKLEELLGYVKNTEIVIKSMGPSLSRKEKEANIALEMTIRVLRVLNEYGISSSATKSPHFDYVSIAVKILALIGEGVGLYRSELTWRDIIQKAKK